ncbi:MAG: hypothetical protein M1833_005946 [Piccolia ochrophora]|nr:MAG: hypothetical protein M1833_005946 [Piccolia ochrophora]
MALSLVTNKAVLDAGPRGDDVQVEGVSGQELSRTLEKGKADHHEVLEAGERAADAVQALVQRVVDDLLPSMV